MGFHIIRTNAMNKKSIGTNAGIIWNLLNNNQKWSIQQLRDASGLSEEEIYTAIGWLARENKIEMDNSVEGRQDYYLMIAYYFYTPLVLRAPISLYILFPAMHNVRADYYPWAGYYSAPFSRGRV